MPISHQYKTIQIHIPKTAGESIEKKLGIYGLTANPLNILWGVHGKYILQHLTISQMKRLYISEYTYNNYFKFSFVRNPWDKVVSEYYWYLRYGMPMTFKDWVKTLESRLRSSTNLHILEVGHNIPQYKYIYGDNGDLLVDFVGRFENLQADFNHVCETIGIDDAVLSRSESTAAKGRKHYREYYDEESKHIVSTVYKKDIELFSYEY